MGLVRRVRILAVAAEDSVVEVVLRMSSDIALMLIASVSRLDYLVAICEDALCYLDYSVMGITKGFANQAC